MNCRGLRLVILRDLGQMTRAVPHYRKNTPSTANSTGAITVGSGWLTVFIVFADRPLTLGRCRRGAFDGGPPSLILPDEEANCFQTPVTPPKQALSPSKRIRTRVNRRFVPETHRVAGCAREITKNWPAFARTDQRCNFNHPLRLLLALH